MEYERPDEDAPGIYEQMLPAVEGAEMWDPTPDQCIPGCDPGDCNCS